MSAIPQGFVEKTSKLSEEVIRPSPNSRKVHIQGSREDLREIEQTPTHTDAGVEQNPPIPVYDTSDPYTAPEACIDLMKGLAPLRARWIEERGTLGSRGVA